MSDIITIKPIGWVKSTRKKLEDDHWDLESCYIELDGDQFSQDALVGLHDFSHVEILFYMNQVLREKIETGSRHPRNNPHLPKVGIFSQRGKNRPNQIGTTICKIDRIEALNLYVIGLDAIDATPVLDIKPWFKEYGPRGIIRQPHWVSELMRDYW